MRLRSASATPVIAVGVAALVVARSAVFVFWPQSFFNANQAVFGLMAKHIAEGRAWPVFMYGQNYLLAVESWLAAPLFLMAGPSVTALKLPLLGINLAIALLLVRLLHREAGLPPVLAAVAAVFFVMPPPGTAAQLLEANGENIEPFLYVLLLWLTRSRPVLCGLIFGIGFLNRAFTAYGFLALLIVEAARGSLFTRSGVERTGRMLRVAAEVWLVVQLLSRSGPAVGPGTTVASLGASRTDLAEISRRICFNWRTVPAGFAHLATIHWPLLFGTFPQHLSDYGIESGVRQGLHGTWILLAAAMLLAIGRILQYFARGRPWRREFDVCAYLVLVGTISASTYVLTRCGFMNLDKMNYELLSILGAVGVAAWYLTIEPSRAARAAWIGLVVAWATIAAAAHGRLWMEYRHPPHGEKELIARHLEARGVKYGLADYWIAYPVAFLTDERVIMLSTNRRRIRQYDRQVSAHLDEAVRVSREPCGTTAPVMPHIYFCPP